MLGGAAALISFLGALHATAAAATGAERGDDQAAAHRLLLSRRADNRSVGGRAGWQRAWRVSHGPRGPPQAVCRPGAPCRLAQPSGVAHLALLLAPGVDAQSRLFLTLYPCRGAAAARPFGQSKDQGKALGTLCHYAEHDPLKGVSLNMNAAPRLFRRNPDGGPPRRPFVRCRRSPAHPPLSALLHQPSPSSQVTHASGAHERMALAFLGAAIPPASRQWASAWQRVLPATRELRAHPVLLVDSARGGVCNVTTLDRVLGLGPPKRRVVRRGG